MKRWVAPWMLATAAAYGGDLPTHMEMRDLALPLRVLDTPSGLRVIAEQDRTTRRAAVVVVVDTGGVDDPPAQEGLAHLVEHLAFRARLDGMRPYTDLLDLAGAGSWNAFTAHDVTAYFSLGASESLPALLKLEMSRALDPLRGVDAATFDVEREVVRNELHQRDEQGAVSGVATELAAALYPPGHRYARPVIGTDASLSRLTLEGAQAFVRDHYVPHRMTLVVAGDLDLQQLPKLLDETLPPSLLADAPAGAVTHTPRIAGPPPLPDPPDGPRLRRIHGPGDLPTLHIGWSLPPGFGKDGYLEQFAATVLGAAVSRAFKDNEILGITSSLDRQKFASTLTLTVTLATGKDPEASMERVLDQVFAVWAGGSASEALSGRDGVSDARAQQFMLNHLERFAAVQLATEAESLLDRSLGRALFAHLTGDPAFFRKELGAIASLGAGEISSFTHRWLNRGRARAVLVEPIHGRAPFTEGGVPPVFASVSSLRLTVAPGAIERRAIPPGAVVTTFRMENGLEVVLARRPAAPVVAVTLVSRGGRADAEPLGAGEMVSMAGLRDTRDWFGTSIGVRPREWTGRTATFFQFDSANGNLENSLAMLQKLVDSLNMWEGVNVGYHWEVKDRLIRFFGLPRAQAEREIRQAVYRDAPLGRTATPEQIERASSATNRWIQRTLTPRNSVLVISGDVLPDAEGAVRRWLGGWKRPGEALANFPPPPPIAETGPVRVVRTSRSGAQQTDVTVACAIPVTSEVELAALEVLGEDVRARLHQLARSALGASYGFAAQVLVDRGIGELRLDGLIDDNGLVRVLAVTRHEMDQLGATALPAERLELARWRQAIRSTGQLDHASSLGRVMGSYRLSGLPADTLERAPRTLGALRAEDVGRAASLCRKTVVVHLLGSPDTLERAVRSTGG